MTHYSEDDLTLYYYGEARRRADIEVHLGACAACASLYREIAGTLAMIAAPEVPERGDQYGLEMWQRIRHKLPEQDAPWWTALFRYDRLALAAATALFVVAAFVAGLTWRQPRARSTSMPGAPQIASEMKILIAEDDAVASQILQLTLERMGHEVVVTRTGTEAWETFDRAPVRVVVSDWMMPGIDGLEFCHRVRARPNTPYTYFILLTALNTGAENYDLTTEAGIDDFLTKPLDATAIRMRLRVADRILWFTREVHQLKQLIPICAYCHKIHTAEDYWQRFETYIKQQTGSEFSHGVCPECLEGEMAKLRCAR